MVLQTIHKLLVKILEVERRLEPFFRPALNYLLREPTAALIQYTINFRRPDDKLALAEERVDPREEESLDEVIRLMTGQMCGRFKPGHFERGGNTKTHGLVRATVTIRDDIPQRMKKGLFAQVRSFPAWVRFSGPGPDVPRDIQDVGFSSMAMKVMDVPGPKLMEDEAYTQDLICICTPTFVTPDINANARLQDWSLRDMPLYYFLDPRDSHLRDFAMQSLWNETQFNPLGHRYYSCVPYLLGEGQAMQYSFAPRTRVNRRIPGVPFGAVPDNYLRDNMVGTLAQQDVEFDLMVQLQTDAYRMPIENAAVRWPEKLSPFIAVATINIPRQTFDHPKQFEFTRRLSLNPWHSLHEHRPLGNQSRARRRMYLELSRLRQEMNSTSHVEPTGQETFG